MNKTKILAGIGLLGVLLWIAFSPRTEQTGQSAANITVSQGESLSQQLISNADLPPEGTRSLFDHHVASLGELSYPFEELLDSLKTLDRWGQGSVSLLIPDGRSLARGHANYHHPRVLVAAQLDPVVDESEIAPIYSGRLFIGFVDAINTIELIAYNEAAGRFEFQLVENYCEGCTPRIIYAKRDICMACHHSGSPIFSVRPWSETNAHRTIAERIASKRDITWSQASSTQYNGVALSTQITMPESFDELADLGSELTLAQRVWLDGCGEEGLHCRRAMLAQALSLLVDPGGFNPTSPENRELVVLQKQSWPEKGIAVPDDNLPDREPAEPALYADLIHAWKTFWRDWLDSGADSKDSATRLKEFEALPKLPVSVDPLAAREPVEILQSDSMTGVHAIAKLFSPHDREMLTRLSNGDLQKITQPIHAGELDALLTASPLSRVSVLQKLGKHLGQDGLKYCCLDTGQLSPPVSEHTQQLAITPGSDLEVFERYCFACHRGNPVERLNFMGGSSEAEVLASIRAMERIQDVLNYSEYEDTGRPARLMPPPSSEQRHMLESAFENGSDDLQRMIDVVNSE